VDEDGHGQHGHGRILINNAANFKIRLPVLEKSKTGSRILLFRGGVD
jgi:hypothetical protein